jgi:hypothetical protein
MIPMNCSSLWARRIFTYGLEESAFQDSDRYEGKLHVTLRPTWPFNAGFTKLLNHRYAPRILLRRFVDAVSGVEVVYPIIGRLASKPQLGSYSYFKLSDVTSTVSLNCIRSI